jgi:hypothetical protein
MSVLHGDAKMTSQMVAALQDTGGDVDVTNSNGDTVRPHLPSQLNSVVRHCTRLVRTYDDGVTKVILVGPNSSV